MIHSLHLCSTADWNERNPIYASGFNHLNESFKRRLRPRSPSEEVALLHAQLAMAARLLPEVLDFSAIAVDITKRRFTTEESSGPTRR